MLRAVRALAIAVLCAAVLAGCGGDDSAATSEYARAVNVVQDRYQRSAARVQAAVDTAISTPAQQRRALDRLDAAVDRAVAALKAIKPPDGLAPAHGRLVEALSAYGPVIAARRSASGTRNPRELIAASTSFQAGSEVVNTRVQQAIDQINDEL